MAELDDLLAGIFDGNSQALYADFERWVRGSRRFRAFATSYRTKIRAKLKNVRDAGGMQDLRAELAVAELLLHDERFTVEYENYAALKQRGPDFTVMFKTHTPFNVEVRHIRDTDLGDGDAQTRTAKLVAVLCDKAAQMPPRIVNLLWLASDRELPEAEVTGATSVLRVLAERKEDAFFARFGYEDAGDFLRRYSRLSGIVVREAGEITLWQNPLARHKLPQEIANAIRRLGRPALPAH